MLISGNSCQMGPMRRLAFLSAIVLILAQGASARPAVDAVVGYPPIAERADQRCTDDGRDCVRLDHYVADVCKLIERNASQNRLDPNFLARLLWKESRFEPSAVSPAGAIGIAQFIPSTAELYDLHDPFNPAEAISRSAWYLRYLTDMTGNIGLAAVAYNGGENRAARFIAGRSVLPYETQDYVEAITGHNAWRWRDNPPPDDELKLALDPRQPFHAACVELAGNRSLREFTVEPPTQPWGVILASHPSRSGAQQQVARLNRALRPVLEGKRIGFVRKRMSGSGRRVYTAQVGYETRGEANAFCVRLKQLGGRCIVLKN